MKPKENIKIQVEKRSFEKVLKKYRLVNNISLLTFYYKRCSIVPINNAIIIKLEEIILSIKWE